MNKYQRWKGIMKAYPFEEKRLAKWEPPFIVQPKYDGVRCRAVPIQTGVSDTYMLLSSEENVIHSVPHINQALTDLYLQSELDGELYCHGMSFEEIVSITSRTVNVHSDYSKVQFHIFDIINELPQMKRQILVDNLRDMHPNLQIAPFWICTSLDDIMKTYDHLIKLGYEGIIVRNIHAPYERKRSTMVMKLKPKKSDIYKILGYQEEISVCGVPKGRLGALLCVGSDGTKFKVGSGFNEDDRIKLWDEKESLSGKYAKISYQHITASGKVPRFPIFTEIIDYDRAMEDDPSISSL